MATTRGVFDLYYPQLLASANALATDIQLQKPHTFFILNLLCKDPRIVRQVRDSPPPYLLGAYHLSLQQTLDLLLFTIVRNTSRHAPVPMFVVVACKTICRIFEIGDGHQSEKLRRSMTSNGFDFTPHLDNAYRLMTQHQPTEPSLVDRIVHHIKEIAMTTGRPTNTCRLETYAVLCNRPVERLGVCSTEMHEPLFRSLLQRNIRRNVLQDYVRRYCCTSGGDEARVARTSTGKVSVVRLTDASRQFQRRGVFRDRVSAVTFMCRVIEDTTGVGPHFSAEEYISIYG
jgi:hypothetical protein